MRSLQRFLASLSRAVFFVPMLSAHAVADTRTYEKEINLRSASNTEINLRAVIAETDGEQNGSGDGVKLRELVRIDVSSRFGGDIRDSFSKMRAVLVFKCSALHYPKSWSYGSEITLDLFQASGGAPMNAYSSERKLLDRSAFGDTDSCRTELAVVVDGKWQVDPVNGTNNFALGL
jgi:hypothetical protein